MMFEFKSKSVKNLIKMHDLVILLISALLGSMHNIIPFDKNYFFELVLIILYKLKNQGPQEEKNCRRPNMGPTHIGCNS